MTAVSPPRTRIHPAWLVAGVAFVALLGAAGFRAAPGVLMVPLQDEFGWSRGTLSLAVGVNLVLFGLTAPFAAALMDRFGIRRVTSSALVLIALGSGLSIFVRESWQLVLTWGVLIGLGTGSMALVFAATVAQRWFVKQRGLVTGILTAGSATGQLIFLPVVAVVAEQAGWRVASLVIAAAALSVVPLVLLVMRDRPEDLGVLPYGAAEPTQSPVLESDQVDLPAQPGAGRMAVDALRVAARTRTFWALVAGFAICGATTNGLIGTHFVPAAHDHGMGETTAAGLLAVVGIFDIVGTIGSGWLTDRYDPRLLLGFYYFFRGVGPGPAAGAARRRGAPEHRGVRGDLRPGLGGHRAADRRAVPAGLRRPRHRGVRLGVRLPPDRRGDRVGGRRLRARPHRHLHRRLVQRRAALRGGRRDLAAGLARPGAHLSRMRQRALCDALAHTTRCPRWDSNPHCKVFKTSSSAVGIRGRAVSLPERAPRPGPARRRASARSACR